MMSAPSELDGGHMFNIFPRNVVDHKIISGHPIKEDLVGKLCS